VADPKHPKLIRLSIRDFALPSPRSGSIDAYSGYRSSAQEGIELHQEIQKKRAREATENEPYSAEVKLSRTFTRGGYDFQIEGRMDGIFLGPKPRIEEIKSTFNIWELRSAMEEARGTHPYSLQLLTYGYFYALDSSTHPDLTFHLVSTRNRETMDFPLTLNIEAYEAWLENRLNELVEEAKRAEKRTARRKKISLNFPFPFPQPRSGQIELIETIERGMAEKKRMLIQAPTGLGKTAGVLYPTLKESLSRGQRVVYVTPKNSQHAVAEDAVTRFQDTGSPVKSLTITAKSKLCLKAEPLCNPTYCEYARDYYDKVAENELVESLGRKKKLSARVFKTLGEKFEVCPFELQLEAVPDADVVICDYNYVFSPQSALRRFSGESFSSEGKPNLVIDEAHNLPSRTADFYSPSLSSFVLVRMRNESTHLSKRFKREFEELLEECIDVIVKCKPSGPEKSAPIEPPVGPFSDMDGKLRAFLSRYLESDAEIRPKDPVLQLCFYWGEFTGILEEISSVARDEFFTTFQPDRTGGIVKITCCDASRMVKPNYDDYDQVVGFSATLKPFEFYARLSGFEEKEIMTAEFESPFQKSNRKLLIIPQVSTKFSDREKNYGRIAETISRVSSLKQGNYLVFFPSFDFLERVLAQFKTPDGFSLRAQERFLKISVVEEMLDELRAQEKPILLFAVQGGVFSEGVDYPGDMVVGAFVVGPPLPNFNLERETMKKYFDDHYRDGFGYAYSYPAMAKAVQAAGRVIRTEKDRGVIVLMDGRFIDTGYSKSMPRDWFIDSPLELVSRSILKDVSDFWATNENTEFFSDLPPSKN
jgi:DNA excision repair protein ERCC-2